MQRGKAKHHREDLADRCGLARGLRTGVAPVWSGDQDILVSVGAKGGIQHCILRWAKKMLYLPEYPEVEFSELCHLGKTCLLRHFVL